MGRTLLYKYITFDTTVVIIGNHVPFRNENMQKGEYGNKILNTNI